MSILVLFGIVLVVVNDLGTNLVSEEWASRDCDLTLAQHVSVQSVQVSTAVWSVTGEEHKRSRSEEGNQPSSPSSTEEPPTWISIGIWMVSKHYSQRHSIILIPTIALGGTLLILISFGWNPPAKFSLQWQWDASSANSKLVPRKSSRQTVQG